MPIALNLVDNIAEMVLQELAHNATVAFPVSTIEWSVSTDYAERETVDLLTDSPGAITSGTPSNGTTGAGARLSIHGSVSILQSVSEQ